MVSIRMDELVWPCKSRAKPAILAASAAGVMAVVDESGVYPEEVAVFTEGVKVDEPRHIHPLALTAKRS